MGSPRHRYHQRGGGGGLDCEWKQWVEKSHPPSQGFILVTGCWLYCLCHIKHRWEFRWRKSWPVWGKDACFRGLEWSAFEGGEWNNCERKTYGFPQVWTTAGKWNCASVQLYNMWENLQPQKEQHIQPEVHDRLQRRTRTEPWSQTKHRRRAQRDQTISTLPNSMWSHRCRCSSHRFTNICETSVFCGHPAVVSHVLKRSCHSRWCPYSEKQIVSLHLGWL